jgi:hypothetical protein
MTMRITRDQKIGGIAALDARHLLRKCSSEGLGNWLTFHQDLIEEELYKLSHKRKFGTSDRNCSPRLYAKERAAAGRESARFIQNLVREGFAEADEPTCPADHGKQYRLTKTGEELCRRASPLKK